MQRTSSTHQINQLFFDLLEKFAFMNWKLEFVSFHKMDED